MDNFEKQYTITFWEINPEENGEKRIVRIPTTKEAFDEYYRPINAYRKTEQRHGRCMCPTKMHLLCNMDCATCKYRISGDTESLNAKVDYEGDEDHIDLIEAPGSDFVPDLLNAELIRELHRKVDELSPEYQQICRSIMAGKPERDMAVEMNLSKTSLHRRKEKALTILREALKNYFYEF